MLTYEGRKILEIYRSIRDSIMEKLAEEGFTEIKLRCVYRVIPFLQVQIRCKHLLLYLSPDLYYVTLEQCLPRELIFGPVKPWNKLVFIALIAKFLALFPIFKACLALQLRYLA